MDSFLYKDLVERSKDNFKEYFFDPKDLVQNNSGQINRKKGGKKKTLSQGAYEFGNGFFDIKFDGQIGFRTVLPNKDGRGRTPNSSVNKSNHFWWLVSKVYLNKYHLEDAKITMGQFMEKMTQILPEDQVVDFEKLVKDDPELEGLQQSDIFEANEKLENGELKPKPSLLPCPLLSKTLWDDKLLDSESELTPDQPEFEFFKSKLDNASEVDIKNILAIIDDRFGIDSEEARIGKHSSQSNI